MCKVIANTLYISYTWLWSRHLDTAASRSYNYIHARMQGIHIQHPREFCRSRDRCWPLIAGHIPSSLCVVPSRKTGADSLYSLRTGKFYTPWFRVGSRLRLALPSAYIVLYSFLALALSFLRSVYPHAFRFLPFRRSHPVPFHSGCNSHTWLHGVGICSRYPGPRFAMVSRPSRARTSGFDSVRSRYRVTRNMPP